MRVLIVFPGRSLETARPTGAVMPLAPTLLAALTPAGHDVTLVDMFMGDRVDADAEADVVAITVRTPLADIAYRIADDFLARGKKVLLGGPHVFPFAAEAKQHASAVAIGEGEQLWPRMLEDAERDDLSDYYVAGPYPVDRLEGRVHHVKERPDLGGLPTMRRDLLPRDRYFMDSIFTTRGCPNHCRFCPVTDIFGGRIRHRPVDEVVAEVETLGPRYFNVDDSVFGHPQLVDRPEENRYYLDLYRELAALRPRRLWTGAGGLSAVEYPDGRKILDLEELEVEGIGRAKGPDGSPLPPHPAGDLGEEVAHALRGVGGGQGVEIALVGLLGELSATPGVGDPLAHGPPVRLPVSLALLPAEHLQAGGVVDRGLHPEDARRLVVGLHGVGVDPMLHAHALGAVLEVADDLALEVRAHLATEEAHHLPAVDGVHGVVDEGGVDPGERARGVEHHVRGPLALVDAPVVGEALAAEHPAVVRVQHAGEPRELAGQIDSQLMVEDPLDPLHVLHPREAVSLPPIREAGAVQLPGEPLAAVDGDLDAEGEPGLDPGTEEAEEGIDRVVVEVEALRLPRPKLPLLLLPVPMDLEARAGLDRGEDRDQALVDAVAFGDLPREFLLAGPAALQVDDGATGLLGLSAGRLLQAGGGDLGEVGEVHEQNVLAVQEALEAGGVGEAAERAPEDEAVEAGKNSDDFVGVAL